MEIEILQVLKLPSRDLQRFGLNDTFVAYRTEHGVVSSVTIPEDTHDVPKIQAAIKAEIEVRKKIVGTKFSL